MAEYIAKAIRLEYCPQWGEDAWSWTLRSDYTERIVRCRDCRHSMFETDEHDSMLCFNEQWGDFGGHYVNADGSGFCAWGEPRKMSLHG